MFKYVFSPKSQAILNIDFFTVKLTFIFIDVHTGIFVQQTHEQNLTLNKYKFCQFLISVWIEIQASVIPTLSIVCIFEN